MLNDDNQDVDFENNEAETDEVVEVEDTEEDTTDWKAEALKYKGILDRNKNKKADEKPASKKSDDFGYDVKAYLKSSGINADEFDFVKAEMKASGKDIDTLLDSKYFQEGLERHREINKTSNATIKGKRSGGVAVDNVEYWAGKDFADVPIDMRGKVLAHREEKEKNKGQFYNQ